MSTCREPLPQETAVYEIRLTHEGWAVMTGERILQTFHIQREADRAALALGEHAWATGIPAEVRMFGANGALRRAKRFKLPRRKRLKVLATSTASRSSGDDV